MHSERGRETLAGLGVAEDKLRVIPHPVFRGVDRAARRRRDRARARRSSAPTSSSTRRATAVVARRRTPRPARRRRRRVAARLTAETEIDRALAESTVAVFPYRAEIDQSGSLLRALGAGVPAVVYDVGGLAEPVRAFGAGRVVLAGRRRRRSPARSASCSTDAAALAEARAGALARARRADLGRRRGRAPRALPRASVSFRRNRFGDLVQRQLELFAEDEDRAAARGRGGRADVRRRRARRGGGGATATTQLVLEAIADGLEELRDTYASTLDDDAGRGLRGRLSPAPPESASRSVRADL